MQPRKIQNKKFPSRTKSAEGFWCRQGEPATKGIHNRGLTKEKNKVGWNSLGDTPGVQGD